MENQVQLFEHAKFGKVRVVVIDGKIHFVSVDVCRALEIKNSRDALTRLENDEKMTVDLTDSHSGKRGGAQFMTVVNEPGLYRLVFSSRKKEALEFQRWVYHEVLPAIRKTGSYSVVSSAVSKTAKKSKAKKRRSAQNLFACVYALLLSNGIVKIGYSAYPRSRAAKIESETKLNIAQVHFSLFMPREDARLVEWACQKNFSSRRVQGEFFSVTFEEACAVIDSFAKVLVESRLFKSEYGRKIFKVAKKNIIESAKLIGGKKS